MELALTGVNFLTTFHPLAAIMHTSHSPLVVMGDFNARVGSLHAGQARVSPDTVVTTRGRRLLEMCDTLGLHLLNGSKFQPAPARPRYTSFQVGGSSVIDLALVSEALLGPQVAAPLLLDTLPLLPDCSDHAQLSLVLSLRADSLDPPAPVVRAPRARVRVPQLGPLDRLLAETLRGATGPQARLNAFYGRPWKNGAPLNVYVAVYTTHGETPYSTAAVFCGPQHASNWASRVPGTGSDARAALWAALHVVRITDPTRTLRIWARQDYLARTLSHWAAEFARQHWKCAHADLLRPLTVLLKARAAPLR
ncbi:hypothetical protein TRAPUB_12848 [Trametes pubescens]|uniref:Endonuclease/exonuclease/phosphatase domain-containing protein n=1 Tax=Trametes pubescens TaxID=154538 RepID=A0A1M2VSU3_TRAPU|nr:hypothetical protein TRAPUB_12848 [Trametes pubescens]